MMKLYNKCFINFRVYNEFDKAVGTPVIGEGGQSNPKLSICAVDVNGSWEVLLPTLSLRAS